MRVSYRSLSVFLGEMFLVTTLLLTGCSFTKTPVQRQDPFLADYNIRSGVRYPAQASSVLNIVAGHMALAQGSLPQAGRYFDEVARVTTDRPLELDLTRADIALQLGDIPGALLALESAPVEHLGLEEQLVLAGLQLEQGRIAEASAMYRKILSAEPAGLDPLVLDEARSLRMLAELRATPSVLPSCADPRGPITTLTCGRIQESRGQFEPALVLYRLAQEQAPELRSLYLDEYRVLLKVGRSNEVVERLNKSFKANQASDLQKLLSAAAPKNASALLQEIVRLAPGDLSTPDLRGKLAALQLRASHPMSALRQLSITLALEPENDSARYLRASLLAASGRREEARSDLLEIPFSKPSFGQARLLAAQLSRIEGNLGRAQADLRPYVDHFPADKLGVLTYISLLKEQNKFQEGLDLIAAIEASTPAAATWLGLERAHLLMNLGRRAESLEAAEEVLGLDGENSAAQNFIAYELANQSIDLDRARDLAEQAVAADPTEPFYLDTLGWVMFKRGNLSRAEELLSRALELSHGDAVIAEHLGDVREAIAPGSGYAVYQAGLERARDGERNGESQEEQEVRQRLERKVKR